LDPRYARQGLATLRLGAIRDSVEPRGARAFRVVPVGLALPEPGAWWRRQTQWWRPNVRRLADSPDRHTLRQYRGHCLSSGAAAPLGKSVAELGGCIAAARLGGTRDLSDAECAGSLVSCPDHDLPAPGSDSGRGQSGWLPAEPSEVGRLTRPTLAPSVATRHCLSSGCHASLPRRLAD
jgi:hypothetical protein